MTDFLSALPFDGLKTYLAGLGLFFFGLGGLLTHKLDPKTATDNMLAGIAVLGIGHKLAKSDVTDAPPQVTVP